MAIYFVSKDHLGSTRLLTDINGNNVECDDYLPFGEQLSYSGCSNTATTHKFTGKERDAETGLDNFGARYNSSTLGRFVSPDEASFSSPLNPQTWNLYAYVNNNPLSLTDPTGHAPLRNPTYPQCEGACPYQHGSDLDPFDALLNARDGSDMPQVSEFDSDTAQRLADEQTRTTDTSNEVQQAAETASDPLGGPNTDPAQNTVPVSRETYKTADEAATAALDGINKESNVEESEYGGRIVKMGDGKYKYTLPVTQGHPDAVNVDDGGKEGSRIPTGSSNAGIYHTHPDIPGQDPYRFSYADVYHAKQEGVPNYVERPDGSIMKFDYNRTSSPSLYDPNKQVIIREPGL